MVAVDLPSGVDADSGEVAGAAVRADVTVTMHGRKVGLEVAPGRFHAGDVVVADIGLERARDPRTASSPARCSRSSPGSGRSDTKYTAGAVLVVGGSPGMTGAVSLTATAAFRADAGYVTVCAPAESLPVIEGRLLEAVKRPLDEVLRRRSSATTRSRSGPGSAAATSAGRSSGGCSRRPTCRRSSTPTPCTGSSRSSARRRRS